MTRLLGTAFAALALLGSLSQQVSAQTPPPRTFIKDSKGCQFVNPYEKPDALGEFEWSGECKDGFLSGPGTLSYPRTNLSWTGDFVKGEMLQGTFKNSKWTYEGSFEGNQAHGRGVMRFAQDGTTLTSAFTNWNSGPGPVKIAYGNGAHYEGEFNHAEDLFDGEGVYTKADGTVNAGTFVKGVLHGAGTILYSNGVKYQGQVQHGEPGGKGRMQYVDGSTYEGEFLAGKYQGAGVLQYANGTRLEAQFKGGHASGQGKQIYFNGDVYEGEFLGGKLHGAGKLVRQDGTVLEGQWKGDELSGQCTQKLKTLTYRGECLAGKRWGRGHLESNNGYIYEGEFRDDYLHGKGVLQGEDGRYEGDFITGLKEGHGKETSKDGEYEGEYAAGQYHGQGRLRVVAEGVEITYVGSFAAGLFNGVGVLNAGGARLDGNFKDGQFVRGKVEGSERKFEIDVAKQTFLEVLPDGSKRDVTAEDMSDFGIRS